MARFFRRRKFCRFTAEGVQEIDYKDLNTLKAYISETGKIVLCFGTVNRSLLGPTVFAINIIPKADNESMSKNGATNIPA